MLERLREEMKQDENMLRGELRQAQWKLERQEIEDCNELQETLLRSSWNLLQKYKLPIASRIRQDSLTNFYRALQEADTSRRSRMLRNLEDARKFFAKFNEVRGPVLVRDTYRLEAARFMIQDIASQGRPVEEVRDEILAQLAIIYENAGKDDWADNLFMGVAYFLMGEHDKGMDCIAVNLDFGYEEKFSGMLFAQMEKGALSSKEAQDFVNRLKLSELMTSLNISDKDNAEALALFFEGDDEAARKLAGSTQNPVIVHALRLSEQMKGSAQNYARVMELVRRHDALNDRIWSAYAEGLPLMNKYAGEGSERAQVFLGDMLMYGWGTGQDVKKAEGIFSELAEKGNVYAQFVMVQRHFVPVKVETLEAETEAGDGEP